MGAIKVEVENLEVERLMVASLKKSFIVPGSKLTLNRINDERYRFADLLHDHGFLLVEPDDIQFKLKENNEPDEIHIVFSKGISPNKLKRVAVRRTVILQNIISYKVLSADYHHKEYGNAVIYYPGNRIVDLKGISPEFFSAFETYSTERELSIIQALSNLEEVSTVDVEYIPVDSSNVPSVDCVVYLTTKLLSGR